MRVLCKNPYACNTVISSMHIHTVILKRKLIDVPPSVRDVFTANLDPDLQGVPSWEQFGEKLLNMDATDLRQFRACDSPTKAILNKMVATAPSATLEDAFRALEAIGRKDVAELVLQKLESLGSISRPQSLDKPQSSLQRPPLVHQSSSTSSEAPVTQDKPSTLAYSEYASAQHMQHISVGNNPTLSQSNTVNECQKSNLLTKQTSVEQPNLTATATLSTAQTPGIYMHNLQTHAHTIYLHDNIVLLTQVSSVWES